MRPLRERQAERREMLSLKYYVRSQRQRKVRLAGRPVRRAIAKAQANLSEFYNKHRQLWRFVSLLSWFKVANGNAS